MAKMLGSKPASRSATAKRAGNFRYATRLLALEKGKRANQIKESASLKACECLLKSEGWKGTKHPQCPKFPTKKSNMNKCSIVKDGKNKSTVTNHHEKVVIVSKRSSSVSVVKSCSMRRSVSVKKVSYSTSVLLSSEEDSDSDDDSDDDEKDEYTGRRRTVVKRTTSKIKSNYCEPKKADNRSTKKAKAIKLLREKLSPNKRKSNSSMRELRPRFPYSATQEWPTARAHRMASLNALAKVHVLYENEGRNPNENGNEGDDVCLMDFISNEKCSDDKKVMKKDFKTSVTNKGKYDKLKNKDCDKEKCDNQSKSSVAESKITRKNKKRKMSGDVEIIDTRICKRMASLNAQAILAASYLQEKPKKINKKIEKCENSSDFDIKEVILESKCDVKVIEAEQKLEQTKLTRESSGQICNKSSNSAHKETITENKKVESTNMNSIPSVKIPYHHNWNAKPVGSIVLTDNTTEQQRVPATDDDSKIVATTTSSKVGLTQYTEVTKVQINTRKEREIKEESKAERKIERLLENDDVAITQMYHYQSKNANESYCLQMQATYKPASKSLPPSAINMSQSNPLHAHMKDPALPKRTSYYGCPSRNTILTSQPYHISQAVSRIPPVMGMDHHISRQYGGSAFTVPHYGHPPHVSYPHNDYGYYQPAGPLIQPLHDQCTIHKPVPYHPQHHLQQSQITQPPARAPNRDRYSSLETQHPQKTSPKMPSSHTVASPQHQTCIPSTCTPRLETRVSLPCNRIPSVDCVYSSPAYIHNTTTQQSLSELRQRSYDTQNGMRDYTQYKSSSQNYSKPYEQKLYPVKKHCHDNSLGYITSHKDGKVQHKSASQSQEPIHLPQTNSPKQSPVPSHEILATHVEHISHKSEMPSKTQLWRGKTKHESSTASPITYNSYFNESINAESSLVKMSENVIYPLRPPSVIEIVEENNSRDTKTYIQLEVPKNRFREKIVIVDVESDECQNKDEHVKNVKNLHSNDFQPTVDKVSATSEIKDTEENAEMDVRHLDENCHSSQSEDTLKENPDIMVIEVKKKKESAVVRRARLHGKQRTFRDCYNRPLAPLSKTKKIEIALVSEEPPPQILQPLVSLPRLVLPKLPEKKISHGWSWEGDPVDKFVYISNDDPPYMRQCYASMRHLEGDVIKVRDCVLLRSGLRKTDLPFVAKVTALWENPVDGEMTMSLLWYYRPEHTEHGKKSNHMDDELFASKHRDINCVACIEDKCYVLTFGEYCRYRRHCKLIEECCQATVFVVPEVGDYPRKSWLPPSNVSSDMVFFCRKMYDYRQKRLLKNPT